MTLEEKKQFVRDYIHEEVEFKNHRDGPYKRTLLGLSVDGLFKDQYGMSWPCAAEIGKPKGRLMKPIELAGKWIDFGEDAGMSLVIGYDNACIFTGKDEYSVEGLDAGKHGIKGWRDTPTSELNTSFEVEK